MRFFEEQERARAKSRQLVALFVGALVVMEGALNAGTHYFFVWAHKLGLWGPAARRGARYAVEALAGAPWWAHAAVTASSLAVVLGAGAWRSYQLRGGGGAAVAAMAGGAPADARDPLEQRFVNVAQEMALASGTPMPQLFVMRSEGGVNAFAAGWSTEEAAVCVTRGCLEVLSRDELQGVVAHEFSHIHNSDMRLNIRAMGLLYGLYALSIVGAELLDFCRMASFLGSRSDEREERGPGNLLFMALFALGMAFLAFGWIGRGLGLAITAAISRQREYLADASAVQFTRNPDGIGGALRKIGGMSGAREVGSAIAEPKALALSHMFLGAASCKLADGLLATHPPLDDRIERVYGRKMGYLAPPRRAPERRWPEGDEADARASEAAPAAASGFSGEAGRPSGPWEAPRPGRVDPGAAERLSASAWGRDLSLEEDRRQEAAPKAFMVGSGMASAGLPASIRRGASSPAGARGLCLALMVAAQTSKSLEAKDLALASLPIRDHSDFGSMLGGLADCEPGAHVAIVDAAAGSLRALQADQKRSLLVAMEAIAKLDGSVSLRESALLQVASRRMQPPRAMGKARLSERAEQAAVALLWVAKLGGGSPAELESRFERALRQAGVGVPSDKGARAAPEWARLDELAPMQKPALAKAVAVAAGDSESGRDAARIACALIGCPAPYADFMG